MCSLLSSESESFTRDSYSSLLVGESEMTPYLSFTAAYHSIENAWSFAIAEL